MKTENHSTSHVARHVQKIPRSGIRDFFEIVQSMSDVISLGIGEPDFVTPWHIREAAIYALERGKTGYTSNLGTPALRREISAFVGKRYGVEYDWKSEVLVSVGVSEALDIALRAIINPGDEILYHEPCYVSYNPSVVLAHGRPVAVPTRAEDGFVLKAEDIRRVLTPKSRALMLNFPTNPTGAILPRSEQEKIAELCIEHDLVVLTDEIYSDLSYEGELPSIASVPGMRERTVFLNGFSKAYAMTGFRIGYACAPAELTEAMMRVHQYSMLCASIISQEAAVEALRNGDAAMQSMREEYRRRRNFLVHHFKNMGLPCHEPKGAFYLFPDIRSTGLGSREFAIRLLEEKKVAVVPGDAFGPCGEGFVRCSYATAMDQLETAVERIADFVKGRK
ncbi:MAG: aminotransferase class I/II-fold pyridoxal phosphate-dependent enzyme [Methylacidiphilales bacterium]|nr:aminotransferase class I/II-fold pyridoxal phosphate-dependent enzyme [Candidatus Methylacidiphilales bacterium]